MKNEIPDTYSRENSQKDSEKKQAGTRSCTRNQRILQYNPTFLNWILLCAYASFTIPFFIHLHTFHRDKAGLYRQ